MVTIYTDRRMLDHIPPAKHPERPERLATILRHLERTGLDRRCATGVVREATDAEILRVHSLAILEEYPRSRSSNPIQVESDTWRSSGSETAGRLAAGAAVEAVSGVISGPDRRALCLVRPPGHHARPSGPMGFCLFASVAIAARDAIERHGLARILIVDWDVHHGNGTQEIFYEDPRVAFFSVHRYPFYPGTGAADETGTGAGLGATRNLPLAFGVSRKKYMAAFQSALQDMADHVRPELVIVSAGFDAHVEDPVGNLGLETEDFAAMTENVIEVASTHAGGRLVSVLEGGYNVPILAGCVEVHLRTLLERDSK